ncbi:TPA: hypothetical protein ACH3X2_008392 [Trebouxia sp. C0005]
MVHSLQLWAQVLCVCALSHIPPISSTTNSADKAALLAFKALVSSDQGLLSSWTNSSDPCSSAWLGIFCNCTALDQVTTLADCVSGQTPNSEHAVIALDLGNQSISKGLQMTGRLVPDLGKLTQLQYLRLDGHRLQGPLPEQLGALSHLQSLNLSSNELTGSLPVSVGQLQIESGMWLDHNQLSGSIPQAWCNASVTSALHIGYNAGLYGAVPQCLQGRLQKGSSYAGTGLIQVENSIEASSSSSSSSYSGSSSSAVGGIGSGTEAPICSSTSCGVTVPAFWTNTSQITFNFTGFQPAHPGQALQYQWGLGTTPNSTNTIPFNAFTGNQILNTIFITNGQLLRNVTVFQQTYSLNNATALVEGQEYHVTVQAFCDESAAAVTATQSAIVKADSTPPAMIAGGMVYSSEKCLNHTAESTTDVTNAMWICWDVFEDPESGVASYSYQIFQLDSPTSLSASPVPSAPSSSSSASSSAFSASRKLLQTPSATPVTPQITLDASSAQRAQLVTGLSLHYGSTYYAQITATNNADLNTTSSSTSIAVTKGASNRSLLIAIVVLASIGVSMLLVACLTAFIVRRRLVRRQEETRAQRGQMKQLKGLMHGLVNVTGDPEKQQLDAIRNARQLAFLITDLQDSTAMASANPVAFRKVQDIHDTLLHEGIAKFNGYEINTEGDSFHIAFTSVAAAVQVAMETQVRLLDSDWPKDVLKLPACGQEKDDKGEKVFRGPRVRMGIHWAVEGTVANRLHLVTKHRVFSGPGFALAQELGDAADGGQVLLSHDAWLNLRHSMCDAGFPQVEQLGMYKLEAWPAPLWIYQVSHQLGRPINRKFHTPRKIEFMEQGWGLNIAPPPEPRPPRELLTFVAVRLFLPKGSSRLPRAVANALYQIIAMVAQQFEGYIFTVNIDEGRCMLTFAKTVDAVRFCHAAQTNVLYHRWPPEALDMCGSIEHTPDGRLLFRGPRVAMAVHETDDYETEVHAAGPMLSQRDDAVVYQGEGERFARRLSKVIHGGQVVLSETAWASIQDQIPGQSQIISLGSHSIDADFEQAVLLMEVMPSLLAKRNFDPLNTLLQLEPGYRDSPEPNDNMAIVFVKVAKPREVRDAEQASSPVSDDTILRVITAFNVGVGKYTKLVRSLLPKYSGYECKEPESGKFTLSFRRLEEAVRWSAAVQKALLGMNWPETLLQWGDCQPTRDPNTGALLWRGLRVRMGMSWGRPSYKKPLNTGRADYFGNLPNLAARVMALAAPGQVLLEGFQGFGPELLHKDELTALLPQQPSMVQGDNDYEAVEVVQLGKYPIKGLDDPKLIFQVLPASLSGRTFELASNAERVPGDASLKRLKMGASFVSGEDSPARSLIIAARANSKRLTSLFGMISRSSSRGGDVRPTGASDPAAGRAGSTIVLASPRELELVRSHNSQLVPGETPAQAYVPSPLGSMGGLAQAVINRVRGIRAGQESPRAEPGRRTMSLLSRSGFRRDSCPTTPLAGVGSSQDPSSTFEAYPELGRSGPPPVRVPASRLNKHRSASEGEDSPESHNASGSEFQDAGRKSMEHSRSPTLQHSHSDLSPHHSLDSASMSPVFANYLQQQQVARFPSRHHKSVTLGTMEWPQGHSRGGGGRRGDWSGVTQPLQIPSSQEPAGLEALQKRLRVEVTSPVATSESADDSGSDVATPNTVYAREVAQLFVSGRHNQFRDASSRFGSLEGSRTLSSRALQMQMQAPTPSLPSSESIGPQHTTSLPPDLQGFPGGPAPTSRLGQGMHQRPARAQLPLAATQSVPAGSRLSALNQAAYLDPTRLTSTNLGAQEQQQAMYGDRFAGSTALRRYSHRRTASIESGGGHSAHGELYPEGSESSWISDAGSFSRQGAFNASNLAVHFEGDEIVEISDMSTGVLDSDPHMEHV